MSRTRFRKLLPLVSTLALILPLLLALAAPVSAATITVCASSCDYTTIQAAVNAAGDGDTINVYPGTYNESVDLNGMSPDGDITIRTVNSGGTPTAGTATVNGVAGKAFRMADHALDGDVTIDGFVVTCSGNGIDLDVVGGHDVIVRNVNADTGDDGIHIKLHDQDGGSITIENCVTDNNGDDGIDLRYRAANVRVANCSASGNENHGLEIDDILGNVEITNCTANDNDEEGIRVQKVGEVNGSSSRGADEEPEVEEQDLDDDHNGVENTGATVRPSANGGNVTIKNCTTNGNGLDGGSDGIYVRDIAGDLLISNCTAIGNGQDGFDPENVEGDVTITASVVRLTVDQEGVDLDLLDDADLILVNGNIICGNECGVGLENIVNLEANWWGCDGGPEAAGCDPICQEDSIAVDYTPWIDTVTASAPASVIVGEPAIVSFQFSGGPPAVYLGEGPGDLRGPAPFTVSTDNGTVTGGFINAPHGVMEVTLVPQTEGTATVTVVGPCGLDGEIVLGVQAAAADFVPEPGSVVLLASGLMGLAGYAGLRMRKR